MEEENEEMDIIQLAEQEKAYELNKEAQKEMKNQAEGVVGFADVGDGEEKPDGVKLDQSGKLMGMLGGALSSRIEDAQA